MKYNFFKCAQALESLSVNGNVIGLLAFLGDCTPLHRHRKTIIHAARRHTARFNLMCPVSSMPDEISKICVL